MILEQGSTNKGQASCLFLQIKFFGTQSCPFVYMSSGLLPSCSRPEQRRCNEDPLASKAKILSGPLRKGLLKGAWVAQSVKRLISAQVMISQLVGSSPASGSVLTAWSLEPVSDSVSPSLSAPPLLALCLPSPACPLSVCLSLSKINKQTLKKMGKKRKSNKQEENWHI